MLVLRNGKSRTSKGISKIRKRKRKFEREIKKKIKQEVKKKEIVIKKNQN